MTARKRQRALACFALASLFLSTGVMHFVHPASFVRVVPSLFPEPALLVAVSGAAEIALAVALLIAVVPEKVNMALHPEIFCDIATPLFFRLRAPFHLVFIAWTAWSGDLFATQRRRHRHAFVMRAW